MNEARVRVRSETPPLALWVIALLAMAPFPVSALLFGFGPAGIGERALSVLMTWSAVVVAFLAGVRWGLESSEARPRWPRLALSALSAAAAWMVLLAQGRLAAPWVLGGFIAVFLIQWLFDHQTPDTPARYPRLSTALTAGACLSLALALEKSINT